MASQGGCVGTEEKFGCVLPSILCLKIIHFTTLLKTNDHFSQPIQVQNNFMWFLPLTSHLISLTCFRQKLLVTLLVSWSTANVHTCFNMLPPKDAKKWNYKLTLFETQNPQNHTLFTGTTSSGHKRECSTRVIQVAPNIWVPKLHTQGVYLSLCRIMALWWRKSYNSIPYRYISFSPIFSTGGKKCQIISFHE